MHTGRIALTGTTISAQNERRVWTLIACRTGAHVACVREPPVLRPRECTSRAATTALFSAASDLNIP